MSNITYTYTVSLPFDIGELSNSITSSSSITKILYGISIISTTLTIDFTSALSGPEETALTNCVNDNTPIVSNPLAFGTSAGENNQGRGANAQGYHAGQNNQGMQSIAFGCYSGQFTQGATAIAIGCQAGQNIQGSGTVALGYLAGQQYQGLGAIAIGYQAGQTGQGQYGIAIGYQAGQTGQGKYGISIGYQAGEYIQASGTVALGYQAGKTGQGLQAIALGYQAGQATQSSNAIAIGCQAGQISQQLQSVAIGYQAGQNSQGLQSVAIGYQAGLSSQYPNSIILNASNASLNSTTTGFFTSPIRQVTGPTGTTYSLGYNTANSEILISNSLQEIDYGELYFSPTTGITGSYAGTPGTILVLTGTINRLFPIYGTISNGSIRLGTSQNVYLRTGTSTTNGWGLIIGKTGVYKVEYYISGFSSTASSNVVYAGIIVNGSAVVNISCNIGTSSVNRVLLSNSGLLSLTTGAIVETRIGQSISNASSFTINQFNMNVIRIA